MNKVPVWLNDRVVDRGSVWVEGTSYSYVVGRHDRLDAPRWFVGLDRETGVYFISDEVPREFREAILCHEMYEFGFLKGEGTDRCLRALQYELQRFSPERREDYVLFRLGMFEALLAWIERDPDRVRQYTNEQLTGMVASRDHLKGLVASR